jgi:small ligand-binding sensory domain FIST
MITSSPVARATIANDADWRVALPRLLNPLAGIASDAVFLFASYHHSAAFGDMLSEVRRHTGSPVVVGCSGMGIVGMDRELENQPAISLLSLSLPGAKLGVARFTQGMIDADPEGSDLGRRIGISRDDVNGWLLFADPFRIDGDGLLAALSKAYPGAPISGGFASPGPEDRRTWIFLNGELYSDGAVGLAVGGDYELLPIVSQGCDPIGEAWTVTGTQSQWIDTISNRPALEVLAETLGGLPADIRDRAQRNLLMGLAVDEYRHEFLRGDFLIRNLVGIDQASGAIAVGTLPRVGQTVQFQMRDAATADLDLSLHLEHARVELAGRIPVAGVLCTCNGRGAGLFGTPHHDAISIGKKLPGMPLAGLFCAGEIGPIGNESFVHGFTASLALIVPTK